MTILATYYIARLILEHSKSNAISSQLSTFKFCAMKNSYEKKKIILCEAGFGEAFIVQQMLYIANTMDLKMMKSESACVD